MTLTETDIARNRSGGTALSIRSVSKSFGGNNAVIGFSLDAAPNEVVGLIGANGAGKTTVLNLASGALKTTSGDVHLGEKQVTHSSAATRARLGLSRTFQHPRLCESLSVLENVMMGARTPTAGIGDLGQFLFNRKEEKRLAEKAASALTTVGIESSRWWLRTSDVPATEHRWIEFARCLASEPSVLLLDEPTSGFTAGEIAKVRELMANLASDFGLAVVLVTHDVSLAVTSSARIVVMDQGQLLASGTPEEILTHEGVKRAYLGSKAQSIASEALAKS